MENQNTIPQAFRCRYYSHTGKATRVAVLTDGTRIPLCRNHKSAALRNFARWEAIANAPESPVGSTWIARGRNATHIFRNGWTACGFSTANMTHERTDWESIPMPERCSDCIAEVSQ